MRKLAIFCATIALTLGAWAYEYNFTITVTCPTDFTKMSDNGGYYLVNTATKTVYSYWMGNEWTVEQKEGTTYFSLNHNLSHEAVIDNSFSVKGTAIENYNVIGQNYQAGESTVKNQASSKEGYKTVIFEHGFTSDTLLDLEGFGSYNLKSGKFSDLAVIVYDSELGIDQTYLVGATGNPANENEVMHFTTAGTMNLVPEPTSGMLLLMGLAGLTLRRRRVA